MAARLGLDGKLYRNTGTYGTPTWTLISNVKDLGLDLDKDEANVTTRNNNGWEALRATLKKAAVGFEMIDDSADTQLTALSTAFFANTTIEFAVMNGDITVPGVQGLRATMDIFKFSRKEGLTEAIMYTLQVKPSYAANGPAWMTVP